MLSILRKRAHTVTHPLSSLHTAVSSSIHRYQTNNMSVRAHTSAPAGVGRECLRNNPCDTSCYCGLRFSKHHPQVFCTDRVQKLHPVRIKMFTPSVCFCFVYFPPFCRYSSNNNSTAAGSARSTNDILWFLQPGSNWAWNPLQFRYRFVLILVSTFELPSGHVSASCKYLLHQSVFHALLFVWGRKAVHLLLHFRIIVSYRPNTFRLYCR